MIAEKPGPLECESLLSPFARAAPLPDFDTAHPPEPPPH